MNFDSRSLSQVLWILLWTSAVPLGMIGVLLLLAILTGALPVNACIITSKKMSDPSGLEFEVRDEDCDTVFYKGESMSVLVSSRGQRDRTLLFKFTPQWEVPPKITVDRQNSTIVISTPPAGADYSRVQKWGQMTVAYEIWNPGNAALVELERQCRAAGCEGWK